MMIIRAALAATLVLGLLASPLTAEAQPAGKVYRIGYLGNSSASLEPDLVEALRQGLRNLGYVENQNIVIEYRWAEGRYDRFPSLVADLIQRQVDVIVTAGTPGALAAKQATRTIPIVMAVSADAVGAGLVDSLARPGANVTGLTTMVQELEGKRIELLKSIVPRLSRIAVLKNPVNPVMAIVFNEARTAARALHVTVEPVDIRAVDEFEIIFATLAKARPGAILVLADRFLLAERERIVSFATRQRLPAMYPYREFVTLGGLMSYSPNYAEAFRRSATYVDKILKGAKPGDLPVEQPTKFELVINLKTARALRLTIPPSLLGQADQVIK